MVYIHGGSFYLGGSREHPPNYLLEHNVILVVIQYRLGPLGFLATMTNEIPGNAALLDVVQALRFVQQHIATFGGDPTRVTVFGQSAGAAIVNLLQYSPAVEDNLYSQLILQSGAFFGKWAIDANPVDSAREIAHVAGCTLNETITDINNCFMAMDVAVLLRAHRENLVNLNKIILCFKYY